MKIELNRRKFLKVLGTLPLLVTTGISTNLKGNIIESKENIIPSKKNIIVPAPLKRGDTVVFTAPASPINKSRISNYVKYFKEKGCEIIIGDTIAKQQNEHRYLSGTDEFRAAEFNKFIADDKVKAIICGRGGYGCMRILRLLDYQGLRNNPKFIMGYSDITALLLAIYAQSGITAYHGPVASSKLTLEHKHNLEQAFFLDNPAIEYKVPEMKSMFPDNKNAIISGKLQGGNLTLIETSLGTPYSIDLTDSLFFIEDTSVLAHDIDRMFASLLNSGELEKCRGILVGKMRKFESRGNFFPNRAFTIKEVIEQYVKKLDIPCIYNLSFGHIESQYVFPLGLETSVDLKSKIISIKKNI